MEQLWRIVGGEDTGGVLVRFGPELSSAKLDERLSFGALVQEHALQGEDPLFQRLHYQLLSGSGPLEGWISVALSHKTLAVRVQRQGLRRTEEQDLALERVGAQGPALAVHISGRWTIRTLQGQGISWFAFAHSPGDVTFSGRQLETNTGIEGGRIEGDFVEWRISDYKVKGRIVEGGKQIVDMRIFDATGAPIGVFAGTRDTTKQRFLVDNTELDASCPGLQYRLSKDTEDCCQEVAGWGTLVLGMDEGDGWVKVLDRFLPKRVSGKTVLRDPGNPPLTSKPTRARGATPPQHLLGIPCASPLKLSREQAVALQRELIEAYSSVLFQRALRSAEGGAEARRKLCSKAQVAALLRHKGASEELPRGVLGEDSELCCNAALLEWLVEPQPAHEAHSITRKVGEYCVLATGSEDEDAIRGIGRCRGIFARAHLELYRPHYSGLLQAEWLSVLGRESTESLLEGGVIVLRAEAEGEVVGYVACRREELNSACISNIAVLPNHQGRGVGSLLFKALVQHLGTAAADLRVNVAELNVRAVNWYRRLGFTVVGFWVHRFTSKAAAAPVVFLNMQRCEGAKLQSARFFGREICRANVFVFHSRAPVKFLELAGQGVWRRLVAVAVQRFEHDTGLHLLQDGRCLDLSAEFAKGRVCFVQPLHVSLACSARS